MSKNLKSNPQDLFLPCIVKNNPSSIRQHGRVVHGPGIRGGGGGGGGGGAEKQFWWAHPLTHPLVSNKILQWERGGGAGASLGHMHASSVAGCTC